MSDGAILTGERYDGVSNLAQLDAGQRGQPKAGQVILVRRTKGDESPLRMLLVSRPTAFRGDLARQVWFVRPDRGNGQEPAQDAPYAAPAPEPKASPTPKKAARKKAATRRKAASKKTARKKAARKKAARKKAARRTAK